jgi:hypothetical protein
MHNGNRSGKSFTVRSNDGRAFTSDSFECAIHALAPACENCGCKVTGHDVEQDGEIFCDSNCARHMGVTAVVDRS